MKIFWMGLFILVILVSCSNSPSAGGGCSENGEVCIKVRAEDPVVFKEPINITITVTSEKDFSRLGISMIAWPINIILGDVAEAEQVVETWKGQSGIDWVVDIKAGETITLIQQLSLPTDQGEYNIVVYASTPQLRAVDQLYIYQTDTDVKIHLSGTKIPITPGPLPTTDPDTLKTLRAMPSPTPLRTLTPIPPIPLVMTPTPTTPAYPPPGSPFPSLPPGTPYP